MSRPENNPAWRAYQESAPVRRDDAPSTNDRPAQRPTQAPAPQRPPPAEEGKRLATCARAAFRDRPAGELRVTLKSYKGNAFVDVRVWDAARDGVTFFPSKAGASIRRGELRAVIEGLTAAAREMGVELDGREADRG